MNRYVMSSLAVGIAAPVCTAQSIQPLNFGPDEIAALSSDSTWLKLSRYQPDFGPGNGVTSDVVTASFFLAEGGRKDPEAEFAATVDALNQPFDPDFAGEHALCTYPARALYMNQVTGQDLFDPFGSCADLSAFANDGTVDSVSVLFIGSYLSNPGSAFGHLLLRFHSDEPNSEEQEWTNNVLERAINYGAAASEEDPMIPYIIKGLTGFYQSTYSSLEFFHHSDRYREKQLRDIWEYKLDLEQDEVDFLVANIWEMLNAKNRYYFLRQNCAYRIAESVELVVDADLSPSGKMWIAPIDVFHALMEDDGKHVASIRRLKSREREFLENYSRLDEDQRGLVDKVLADPEVPLASQLKADPVDDPAPALNVLLDRYAYAGDEEVVETREREVLLARMQMPPTPKRAEPEPPPPHTGQRPSLLQATALHNDELGSGVELRFRPVYFDFLSTTQGTVPWSELSMLDTRVVVREDEVSLRSVEAVKITTLNPLQSGTPNTGASAWQVRFGAESQTLACDDCLEAYGEAGVGRAVEFAPGAVTYGLVSGRVQAGNDTPNYLDAQAKAGLLLRGDDAALHAEVNYIQGLDDLGEGRWTGKVEARIGSGERWDLRFGVAYDEATEGRASLSYYW